MSKTIEVSDETWDKIKGLVKEDEVIEVDVSDMDDFIGKKLFIRTVTYHLIGKVSKRVGKFLELEGAVWVADSGRFMNALKDGTLNEVEPCTVPTWVNIDSIVDMFIWKHALPKEQL
jgi:hypothetical protein